MKKGFLGRIGIFMICLVLLLSLAACGEEQKTGSGSSKKKTAKTLEAVGYYYEEDERPMTKIRTLDDIYLPEGLLEKEFGMWIYDNDHGKWVRTNSEEGRASFREDKPTFIFAHGMGSGAYADDPDVFYAAGYNVLCFHWGAYACEMMFDFADKVWYEGARWQKDDGTWEEEDVCDAAAVEVYGAYYYDFFSHFPDYSGSSVHLFGHSYGGMMSIAATNFLITAYKCKLLPAYMLPDMVTLLDPYLMRCSDGIIPWLGDFTPANGNICEVLYQTALDCKKLGITVRMARFNLSVAYMAVLHQLADDYDGDLNISYWNFVNNIIYAHLELESVPAIGGLENVHNYAWDWFTSYYTGKILYDAEATLTQEQALCFEMDYADSFARTGIKYSISANGTKNNTDDDILRSFYREYKYDGDDDTYPSSDVLKTESLAEIAELTGNAKIAGFVYLDQNKNGKMDERIKDHLSEAVVVIMDSDGNEILSTVTGVNGYYEAEVEETGTYTVQVTLPKGYSLTEGAEAEVEVTIVDAQHQLALNNFGATR